MNLTRATRATDSPCFGKNHIVQRLKGFRLITSRWQEKNSEEFEETYHQRSIVESVFSSFKCRFTVVILAKTLPTQRLQLLLRCVCYNMLSWWNHAKMHVMRLACVVRLGMILAWDAPHHVPTTGKFHQMGRIRTNKARINGQQTSL